MRSVALDSEKMARPEFWMLAAATDCCFPACQGLAASSVLNLTKQRWLPTVPGAIRSSDSHLMLAFSLASDSI